MTCKSAGKDLHFNFQRHLIKMYQSDKLHLLCRSNSFLQFLTVLSVSLPWCRVPCRACMFVVALLYVCMVGNRQRAVSRQGWHRYLSSEKCFDTLPAFYLVYINGSVCSCSHTSIAPPVLPVLCECLSFSISVRVCLLLFFCLSGCRRRRRRHRRSYPFPICRHFSIINLIDYS